jgi:solute carrier family 50 protein (sugar transporter)
LETIYQADIKLSYFPRQFIVYFRYFSNKKHFAIRISIQQTLFTNTINTQYTMAYSTVAASALNVAVKAQPAAWVALCSKTAPLVSSAVFMAPIPTVANIMSTKSTGSLPLLPYSSMVVNAFLWMMYGILTKESKIWSPNAFGFVMGAIYCLQFSKHVPKKASSLPGTLPQHVRLGTIMMTFTLLAALTLDKALSTFLIGKIGVIVCVVLFASPLSTLKDVIATKSAKSIPLP